ncbi:hypothetical protein ASG22_16260 [Chryseobacterium sp. Leaf405]|uniref:CPBP family intramembrane glutamic endopeptidase n=1 Tax=Chryseobacterium sp. Leaf405 TaxID=1736367 RepID=UPI0006F76BA0|nr:CPBP family intramembrane glutamic endopeptidase [Chryseobacterium sp. Leaf405]KQT20969.1 hypothetical protein ASG22_16260 [Chryseobacterium sp. Leaf405]
MNYHPHSNVLYHSKFVIFSPFIIITTNIIVALVFGSLIGKWVFIPIILTEWCMFMFFVLKYGGTASVKQWLKNRNTNWGWIIITVILGLLPLPIFLKFNHLLNDWTVWLPWILIALINPWMEEFYWRGLLLNYTRSWNKLLSVLFSSTLFSANHLVFGIQSELFRGYEVALSTFVMGIVWSITYKKTNSLRWVILSHFLVDFLNLSAPSFLDLYKAGF